MNYDFTHEFCIGGRWAADIEIRAEILTDWLGDGWSIEALHFETARYVGSTLAKEWEPFLPARDGMATLIFRQAMLALREDSYHVRRIEEALAEEGLTSPVDLQSYDAPRVI